MRDWLSTSSQTIFDCSTAATTAAGSVHIHAALQGHAMFTARYIAPGIDIGKSKPPCQSKGNTALTRSSGAIDGNDAMR
jgi:hypothetical protein